ncbi:MAG: radical SAM protein [Planctomycetota bacterium]|nr:radical SAM protein [Planctomycetota bacterium]
MLTGIHFLLTYTCNYECDHCFVRSGPRTEGTFTLAQIKDVLKESKKIGTVEWIYFEGGEPFLFFPLLVEGIKAARRRGFKVGIVTNAYFGISEEDSLLWLRPLQKLGVEDVSLSDDSFHFDGKDVSPARRALAAARRLGLPAGTICVEKPKTGAGGGQAKSAPITGGVAMFRGRAAEKLTEGLPRKHWADFTECPYEDLREPKRVHVDSYGTVHLCQGLSMGNMWKTRLSRLVRKYDAEMHPICGPLVKGGPAALAREYGIGQEARYVDACHCCYMLRTALLDRFPEFLAPRQVYPAGEGER